ncbi:MAG: hypothetical protein M0Q53_09420 [Prolixibacteraceae bacterium]|jgi:hypothetical protein|nr:hypothetical protein [Prolixibacteraceae bacterium]
MNLFGRVLILFITITGFVSCSKSKDLIFIEAGSFSSVGGWVIDQQAIDVMGSPYILAHGVGIPVKDAGTL